jgi:hypothetical protein
VAKPNVKIQMSKQVQNKTMSNAQAIGVWALRIVIDLDFEPGNFDLKYVFDIPP